MPSTAAVVVSVGDVTLLPPEPITSFLAIPVILDGLARYPLAK